MIEDLPDERLLPVDTVAQYLNLSKRTVIKMARGRHDSGRRLPCVKVTERKLLFKVGDIRSFIRENYTG